MALPDVADLVSRVLLTVLCAIIFSGITVIVTILMQPKQEVTHPRQWVVLGYTDTTEIRLSYGGTRPLVLSEHDQHGFLANLTWAMFASYIEAGIFVSADAVRQR